MANPVVVFFDSMAVDLFLDSRIHHLPMDR